MYAAEQLIRVLTPLRSHDSEIQMELDALRIRLAKHWRARDALDVIANSIQRAEGSQYVT